jgi:hypothetical protein
VTGASHSRSAVSLAIRCPAIAVPTLTAMTDERGWVHHPWRSFATPPRRSHRSGGARPAPIAPGHGAMRTPLAGVESRRQPEAVGDRCRTRQAARRDGATIRSTASLRGRASDAVAVDFAVVFVAARSKEISARQTSQVACDRRRNRRSRRLPPGDDQHADTPSRAVRRHPSLPTRPSRRMLIGRGGL